MKRSLRSPRLLQALLLAAAAAALISACGSDSGGASTRGGSTVEGSGTAGAESAAPGAAVPPPGKAVPGESGACPTYDVVVESVFARGVDCATVREVVTSYLGSPVCRSSGAETCEAAGWVCKAGGSGLSVVPCTKGDGRLTLTLRGPR